MTRLFDRTPLLQAPHSRMAARRRMHFVCAVALAAASCKPAPQWHGIVVDPPRDTESFSFTRADGSTYRTGPEKGRALMVFFGYTNCPDVCPSTLADWVRVKKAMGKDADRVRFVFITVDPDRDTPAIAQRYVNQFDSTFVGLSGDSTTNAAIQKAFGVSSQKEASTSAAGYMVGHTAQTFLLNDAGKIVLMYSFGSGWNAMSDDLRHVLD